MFADFRCVSNKSVERLIMTDLRIMNRYCFCSGFRIAYIILWIVS
jgi:hypothetical protein